MRVVPRIACAGPALALAAAMAGCGTPGAPQPPTLNLPDRVDDLTAVRTGDEVVLSWTMPRKNTDRMLLKGELSFRVCRREGPGICEPVSSAGKFAAGANATFRETLAAALAGGPARELTYFVELPNRSGRSAGLSNGAAVLAGQAPGPVRDLHLSVRKEGIELRWTPVPGPSDVRLRRTLLTPPKPGSDTARGPMAPPPDPVEQNLLVENGSAIGRALDKSIRFGETYEYRAQHIVRAAVDNQTLELAGELSAPVRIEAADVFPPATPTGLAAVATAPAPGSPQARPTIDLSWQADTEPDLAGYIVYRRDEGAGWRRISPEQPVAAPAFQDTNVEPGHSYAYAVSAVDGKGHESERSAEARETVPAD